MTLTIGDTNYQGDIRITDTNWDFNGTMRVTVVDTLGTCRIGGTNVRVMRNLARRAISHPEKTRTSRVVNRWTDRAGQVHITFAVSRLND